MDLKEALEECTNTIQAYRETQFEDISQTTGLMKDMAIILYELARHKTKYKQLWNGECFSLRGETSNAMAEKGAHAKYPELDMLRQVIRAGGNVLDAMRSQISFLKQNN